MNVGDRVSHWQHGNGTITFTRRFCLWVRFDGEETDREVGYGDVELIGWPDLV